VGLYLVFLGVLTPTNALSGVCKSPIRVSVANRLPGFLGTPRKVQLTWSFEPPLLLGIFETPATA